MEHRPHASQEYRDSHDERIEYRPESEYFSRDRSFPAWLAIRVVAQTTARWATRYRARAILDPKLNREGVLPNDPANRTKLIDELLEWEAGPDGATGLYLYHDDEKILDQHDGPPAVLWLTPRQFEELQIELNRAGMPHDTYYSVRDLRHVIEPIERHGGVILQESSYSPLDWKRRDASVIASRQVPSEAERKRALLEACERFSSALIRRSLELREPGKKIDDEELAQNIALQKQVGLLIKRLVSQHDGTLSEGSPRPPA